MNRLITIMLILVLGSTSNLMSQEIEHEAPTLQVGLDGINFSKGSLDPEIIARVIAAKQDEIKIKIIQNSFLKKIYGSGGTIYNYTDNIIKGIVQEPDTDVRTRKIMESTVNLVFVYAFADFYLKEVYKIANDPLATKDDKDRLIRLQNLAKGYNLDSLKDFSSGLKYRELLENNSGIISQASSLETKLLLKSSTKLDTIYTRNVFKKVKCVFWECDKTDKDDHLNQFISLIIDISSEVIRNNEKLRDLGLMRVSYSTNYDYLNMYKQQQNFKSFEDNNLYSSLNKGYSKCVYLDMQSFINQYTPYIGALKYVIENKRFKSNTISEFIKIENINEKTNFYTKKFVKNDPTVAEKKSTSFDSFNFTIKKVLDSLSTRFKKNSENKEHVDENYLKDIETAIKKLTASLNYIKKTRKYILEIDVIDKEKVLMLSDMLFTLKMEVIPNIEYSIKFAPELINTKDEITAFAEEIYLIFANKNKYLKNLNKDPEPFLKLVSKLYEFDKTKTFSEYTSLITLLDEVFETGKFKTALSTINTFVKDYTVISTNEKGKEFLEFNVESFLVKLDNIQSDKINRVQFHFTVGMNTTSFINGGIDIGNNEIISNFSHFSEKIGVKFKLINKGDWLPKNPGESYGSLGFNYIKTAAPREPLISNWHVLLYGSGILYNVMNSSTNKEFNYPMVGFGTGVTFYNALDFNVSIGIPLLENGGFTAMTDNAFLSFGFDIQIGEYLKEVGKKRKVRKQNELLASKK